MSVDQFVYHSADHSGSSFFSMLQGVFVYTSGLIGTTDPGTVNIETPVGSIGIRGTVVAGHILPAGQSSQITILDGAITLTNGTGTQEMNTSLATVSLGSYQSQPQSVQMDAKAINESYHSVSAVAGETLTHFAPAVAPAPAAQPDHAPASAAPPAGGSTGESAPAAAPVAPAPHAAAPAEGTAPSGAVVAPTVTAPTITIDSTVVAPPPPTSTTSSFTGTSESTSFTSTSGGSTFTSAPPP